MNRVVAFGRRYWLEALVVAWLAIGALKLALTCGWRPNLTPALLALLGGVSVLFPEEVAVTTGRHGWTRSQGWQDPPEWVRWIGVVFAVGGVGTILAR